jgi:GntR family transcriptional regulator of vanillate catabolism
MGRVRTTLDKPTRAQAVTAALRALIVDGKLEPGERLQEQRLADRLDVSRTPVHESLKTLAEEGLVAYEPHCGFSVRLPDPADVTNAFDVRMVLEGFAAGVVARRGLDDDSLRLLEHNLERAHEVLHGARWNATLQRQWFELNWQFHDVILASADNPHLTRTVVPLRHIPHMIDRRHRLHTRDDLAKLFRREQSQKALADHVAVFDALVKRQPDRAEFLLRDHIFRNREDMVGNFAAWERR